NACHSPDAVSLRPTIWPRSLIAVAPENRPPRVPRSVIFPSRQRNPCIAVPPAASIEPTIQPRSLMSAPYPNGADGSSAPRLVIVPIDAAGGTAMHGFL